MRRHLTRFEKAVSNGDLSTVLAMIRGVEPRELGIELHTVCYDGNLAIVDALLEAGADANEVHPEGGYIPAGRAATFGHAEVLERLLDSGVKANSRDRRRNTPLHHAAGSSNPSVFCIDLLMSRGAKVDAKNRNRQTPLSLAAFYGSPCATRTLLTYGADRNHRDNRDMTPLDIATEQRTYLESLKKDTEAQRLDLLEVERFLKRFPL